MAKNTLWLASAVVPAFLAGTLCSQPVATAATNYVQALKNSASVYINNSFKTDGSSLVYNGTTYTQIYAIQRSLKQAGIQTTWNGHDFNIKVSGLNSNPTNTVNINSLQPASLNQTDGFTHTVNTFTDMFGNTYQGGMDVDTLGDNGNTYYDVTYNLNGNYKQLTGTLVPDITFQGQSQYPELGDLKIIADGKTIYSSGYVTSGMTQPIPVSVDLTNVNKLEIKLEDGPTQNTQISTEYDAQSGGYPTIGFVGVQLHQ